MEDRVHAIAGAKNESRIADVALDQLGAGGRDCGVVSATQDSYGVTLCSQEFDEIEAKKASASGDEHLQGFGVCRHSGFRKERIEISVAGFGKRPKTAEKSRTHCQVRELVRYRCECTVLLYTRCIRFVRVFPDFVWFDLQEKVR